MAGGAEQAHTRAVAEKKPTDETNLRGVCRMAGSLRKLCVERNKDLRERSKVCRAAASAGGLGAMSAKSNPLN